MLGLAKYLFRIRIKPSSQPRFQGLLAILAAIAGLSLCCGTAAHASADPASNRATARIADIPLSFEANQGQIDSQVKFLSRGDGYSLFLTANSAVLKLRTPQRSDAHPPVIRMEMLNAHRAAQVTGTDRLPGVVNYFIGNDPKRWHSDIETYAKVKYQSVYPGVDAVFYGNQRQFEYDFVVAPGADPNQIALGLSGVKPTLDTDGNVTLKTVAGNLLLLKPLVYQGAGDSKTVIAANYTLSGNKVRFRLGKYDRSQPLIIDPKFDYMTYLGGSGIDFVGAGTSPYGGISPSSSLLSNAVAVDSSGNTYVTGQTYSVDFPTHAGYEDKWAGYSGRNQAAFVSKINAAGTAFVYSTYLAGSDPNTDSDNASAIAVDASGDAYVVGWTQSPDFPVTKGAYQTTVGALSAFVTKLNPSGNGLVYSTVLGGAYPTYSAAYGIAVDSKEQAYVVGNISGNDVFPTTSNALVKTANGNAGSGFVTVFNAAGSSLLYSSLIGDAQALQFNTTVQGVAVDPSGNFYITGSTESPNMPVTAGAFQSTFKTPNTSTVAGFAAKFGPATDSGNLLTYLTYLHAKTIGDNDWGAAITADRAGNAYVAGYTQSPTFPTTAGAYQTACLLGGGGSCQDAFVTKINPSGTALVWSTLLGDDNSNPGINGTGVVGGYVSSIALDALGNVYVAGEAGGGFPTVNPVEPDSFGFAGFISKLNSTGTSLLFSSLLGDPGTNNWIAGAAVDPLGNISVGGVVQGVAVGLPVTSGAPQPKYGGGEYDGFVAKIHTETPDLTIAKTHTGNFRQGESAAGYTITISNIGDGPTSGTVTVTEAVPTGLTLESMEGSGWTCSKLPTCTRGDVLAASGNYPPITVTVNVESTAPASVTNIATVAGGSEYNTSNDSASDATTVTPEPIAPAVKVTLSSSSITTAQALTVTIAVSGASGKATPTGSVKLTSGSYASTAATLANGKANISIPAGSLAAGTDKLDVSYTPNSTSSPIYLSATGSGSVTVAKVTPTVKLTLSASIITKAQSLVVTVAVSGAAGDPVATGTVTLKSGSYTSAATTLASGKAVITIPAGDMAKGSDTLTATYSGSTTYNTSSGTASVAVTLVVSTVKVTPAETTLPRADSLAVTVTVSASSGTPAGTVTLSGGGYTSEATALVGGKAIITIPADKLTVGTDTLTASYSGGGNYAAAAGKSAITVTKLTPTVTMTPASTSIARAVSLSVKITVKATAGTPTGTVTLAGGGYTSTATTLANGVATIVIPADKLTVAADTLTATYSGDANDNTASGHVAVTVTKLTPTVTVTPAATTVARTSSLSVIVKLTATEGTPTGTVTLAGGGYTSTATTLTNGAATIVIPADKLTVAADTLTATYSGDANDNTASGHTTVNVTKLTPAVTVTPASTSVIATNSLSVAVKVTATAGVPTGTVTLSGGGYTSTATTLANGEASIAIPADKLTVGTDTLTVSYVGDANDKAASGHTSVTVSK